MITPELIQQVESLDLPSTIYSFSLFKSDKFDFDKHINKLTRFLRTGDNDSKSIFFCTRNTSDYLSGLCPPVNIIEVPQLPFYQNHLYRYLATAAKVNHVVCLGTDEPELHPDLNRCFNTSLLFNYDFVCALMESHPKNLIGGRCIFTDVERQRLNVLSLLAEFFNSPNHILSDWNIDQYFLTDYVKYYSPPTVINCPVGVVKQRTIDFLNHRLDSHPTIVIREPNCYDKFH